MKVGFISAHSFIKPGGVRNHILGLAGEFEKRGIETKIIVPRKKLRENYGKNVILLGTSFPFNFGGTQGDLCVNLNPLAIRKVLRREKFDVLHFHNFALPSAIQVLDRSKALNILTFHANLEAMPDFTKKAYDSRMLVKKFNDRMDGVIGVADLNLKQFKKFKKPKKIIPNGIDIEEFNPSVGKIERFNDDKINILFVGRMEERKGLIYLLDSFRILQEDFDNLRLIIVGDGPLRKECVEFVRNNRLKNVVFEGEKTGKIIPKYFNTCDIFCSPAIFGESFGIVLLEAMACKKPVVGFSNRGYKELLKDTKGARFLVDPRDSIGLAEKLEELIVSEKLRREMGEWGMEYAKKFSWEKIADQVLDFYKECGLDNVV